MPPKAAPQNFAGMPYMPMPGLNAVPPNGNNGSFERAFHGRLTTAWPNLNAAQRQRVANWILLYGPNANILNQIYVNPAVGSTEFFVLRMHRFAGQNIKGFAKCHTCWASNAPMPQNQSIPIGLDNIPTLPCGCWLSDALLELWAINVGIVTGIQNNGRLTALGRDRRTMMREAIKNVLGLGPNHQLTLQHLINPQVRATLLQGNVATMPNPHCNAAWPAGTGS